ncbi:MAG: hypothetical protein K5981_09940 [Clostridia bacterium]|nr:hypothetical protein [Clostridia bacterium]
MSLDTMRIIEQAEADARQKIADAKQAAKTAADEAAKAGRQQVDDAGKAAKRHAEEMLENAKLVGRASCADIERASADAIASLRAGAEKKLPEAARFIAERIVSGL